MTCFHGRLLALLAVLSVVLATVLGADDKVDPARRDRHGDALPEGSLARLGTTRLRNGAGIFAVLYSPDGKIVASAGGSPWAQQGVQSGDSSIRLWEASTGREVRTLQGLPGGVTCIAFSPDGKLLAASTIQDNIIRLWDVHSDEPPRQLSVPFEGSGWFCFAFSPDSKMLAVPGGPEQALRLLDVASGKELRHFGKNTGYVTSLAFAPDGRTLASKSPVGVRLWDLASGQTTRILRPRSFFAKQKYLNVEQARLPLAVTAPVAFSADGKILAAEFGDNTVYLWEPASGKELGKLVHRGGVVSASFAPDGKTLATGCVDNTLRLWDLASGKELLHLEQHHGGYMAVAFAPDGKTIASGGGDHTVHLWNVSTGKERLPPGGHQGEVFAGVFAADSKVFVSAGRDNVIRFWDPAVGQELRHVLNPEEINERVAFAPDGKTLATTNDDDEIIRIWDVATGKLLRSLATPCHALSYSPDSKHLAVIGDDFKLCLWDLASGKKLHFDTGPDASAFAFAPDGKTLAIFAAESPANHIRLWDLATRKEVRPFETLPESEAVVGIIFSPDGTRLATIHPSNVYQLWDVSSGKPLHRLQHSPESAFSNMSPSAVFSPDGRTLATSSSGAREVLLWEVATGKERRRFQGHRGPVGFVAFAPDGKSVASGSWDTTVLVWDVRGLKPDERLAELSGPDLEALWSDLADEDAAKSFLAVRKLIAAPKQAVPFLLKQLPPSVAVPRERIQKLLADLDSEQFGVREKASTELEKLGVQAEPELKKVLLGEVSLEVRRRVEQLLEKLRAPVPSSDRLRSGRAVEVLEALATPEARQLLEKLAQGAAVAPLSREAKAALQRLGSR